MSKYDGYVKFLEKAEEDGFYDWIPGNFSPRERLPFKNNSNLNPFNFNGGYLRNIPEKIQFELPDIKRDMTFRKKDDKGIIWIPISITLGYVVFYGISHFDVGYGELFDEYEYSTDNKTWNPCKKEPK